MITEAGKKWIAEHFGVGDCWVYSGLSWTTYYTGGGSDAETGGTAKITARLTNPAVNERVVLSSPRTGTYRTADLTSGNGGNVVSLDDVKFTIMPNDGYPAGETQYCYTPGAPPVPPPIGDTGTFYFCSLPGGATITVDGAVVPWKAPLCPAYKPYTVTAAGHTIRYTLAGYKDKELSVGTGPGGVIQVPGIMEAVAGVNNGTLKLTAHDDKTGQELHARPSISGTTEESKFLTPYTITLSIAAGKTSKEVDVGAIHPGYEKAERTVTLRNTHTVASPLVVDLKMHAVRLWREVRIVEKMPTVAWVTGLSIPSVMAWGVNYTGWVKFVFTSPASYQAHLDLHSIPTGWDGTIESLGPLVKRISTEEGLSLVPFPKNEISLDWAWTPTSAQISEGNYVVVCVLEYW